MRARRFFVSLVVVLTACTSATSRAAPSATGGSSAGSAPPSLDPSALIKGETFPVGGGLDLARYTTTERAQKASAVTIQIVAYQGAPAFEPTVIEASPGEMLKVTVAQNDDLSAHFQHNFSITALGIDQDIPKGAGHHITVDVTVPQSGQLEFFCKYHLDERHAGTFLVAG